ncbi:MAG: 30S ribosomal protein S27e [Candidatus Hydrothermarchaeota archaeon]|nr:30S ribosomal protein S27e [Euryarchaeota archaeon]
MDLIPKPESRFLKVKCLDCSNEQVIFDSATTVIKCHVCGKSIAEPRGGKANILTKNITPLE